MGSAASYPGLCYLLVLCSALPWGSCFSTLQHSFRVICPFIRPRACQAWDLVAVSQHLYAFVLRDGDFSPSVQSGALSMALATAFRLFYLARFSAASSTIRMPSII